MSHIQYQRGDIFDSQAQVIVNTVNCEGFMGKGLALAFKERYPDMFPVYQEECKTGKLRIGRPTLYQRSTPWILNFPTKDKWRANSKIEYLKKGLKYFVDNYKKAGITSIAFPKLGTQNGKLSWNEVGPVMVSYLGKLDIDVYIYIAEGDKEYFADDHAEEATWKQFSELALSQDRLVKEVELSPREAKKVFAKRESIEFTSLSDIDSIEGLARVSLQRVKDYIRHQLYTANELPGMGRGGKTAPRKTKKKAHAVKQRRKRPKTQDEHVDAAPLFSFA